MVHFSWHAFSELTVEQLYAVLMLRSEVFVLEQQCAYLDPDGRDHVALHLLGIDGKSLVAYLRLFLPTESQSALIFGRVVTAKSARANGYGKKLMAELLTYCDTHYPDKYIKCSAQYYLKSFYESVGFVIQGEPYDEDGILHIAMQRKPHS